ncbi:MAG TPA: zf-HC2 domain-containing protein, partial [Blastocatellia bacterium]|nr:zf-HC2 domain-containing protein [Blastocatellia bacterium]
MHRYRLRKLAPSELIAASDHLASCDECYRTYGAADPTQAVHEALCRELQSAGGVETIHLSYDQMEAYADGELDSQQVDFVRGHTASCDDCASDLRGILNLRDGMPGRVSDSNIEIQGPPAPVERFRSKLLWKRQPAAVRITVWAASVVVAVTATSFVLERSQRAELAGLNGRIAALERSNSELEQEVRRISQANSGLIRPPSPAGGAEASSSSAQSTAVITLSDGNRRVIIGPDGHVEGLGTMPLHYKELVGSTLLTGRPEMPSNPKTQLGKVGHLLGAGSGPQFEVLSPVGVAVEQIRPTFRWQALKGATSYEVLLRDLTSGQETGSGSITASTWSPERGLVRGHTYAWMVEALKDDRRVRAPALAKPYAAFRVLRGQKAIELENARREWGDSHLLLGVLYAKAGVID